MMRFVLAASALVACGESARPTTAVEIAPIPTSSAEVDAGSNTTMPATANALIARTCGPTDGPATTMIVTDEILSCDDWQSARKRAYVSIETWGSLKLADHTTITLPGEYGGEVSTCTADGKCERVTRASLTIDHASGPEGFDGSLDVTPKTGAHRHIVVHAIRCELHIMCG